MHTQRDLLQFCALQYRSVYEALQQFTRFKTTLQEIIFHKVYWVNLCH
jgi:hypothetical protein